MAIANWTQTQVLGQLNSGSTWSGGTITYSFPGTSSALYTQNGEGPGFRAFNGNQQTQAVLALATWDDLIAPNFAPGTAGSTQIEFGYTSTGIGFAHAYFPQVGSAWFNSGESDLVNPVLGGYGFQTLVHELGHALGLNHMGDYNGNGNWQPSSYQDSVVLSVMSYYGPRYAAPYYSAEVAQADWVWTDGNTYSPQTPMLNDIMAIQTMYGASTTTRLDNTVYGFSSTVGGATAAIYDFSINRTPILTIYDAGGSDTLDLSGWSAPATIDLHPGAFSSANSMTNNIAIAYNTTIENASGGTGNDVIAGNDVANTLRGNGGNDDLRGSAGDDTLVGGTGNDTLDGGSGSDTAVFEGNFASYTIGIAGDVVTVSGTASGTDQVSGVERFQFADTTRTLGELSPNSDTTAPAVTSLSPTDNATGVAVGAQLVLSFDEAVKAGSGTISIFNADGTLVRSISATDTAQLRIAGSTVTIDPAADLTAGRSYYVTVSAGAITDLAGNAFAGISGTTTWSFATATGTSDTTAPQILSITPADGSTGAGIAADLTIVFNEAVAAGSGNITLRNSQGTARTIAVTDTSQVTIAGNTVTINPSSDLTAGMAYTVTIDAGALRDLAGNSHAGLASTTAWNFTTASGSTGDDYPYSTDTPGVVSINGALAAGVIEIPDDADLFRVELTAGVTYTFDLQRTAGGLTDPYLALFNPSLIDVAEDDDSGGAGNARIGYTALVTGTHYLAVVDYSTGTGAYTLRATTTDSQAPTLISRSPADDGTGIAVGADLVLGFSEPVQAGSGSVRIYNATNGALVREIRASDSAVQISGSNVTINPGENLPAGTSYYVQVDANAFRDAAGNAFAGVSGTTAWNFATAAATSNDDYPMNVNTPGLLAVNGSTLQARIDHANDGDLFRVNLVAGITYQFDLIAPSNSAVDPYLALYGLLPEAALITYDDDSGPLPYDSRIYYTASATGTYYLAAWDYAEATGVYSISAKTTSDDYLGSTATSGRIISGGATIAGTIDVPGDIDMFALSVVAGQQYSVNLRSTGLADPYLVLMDASGQPLLYDDDTLGSYSSQINFTAERSGNVFLAAFDFDTGSGSYQINAFQRNVFTGTSAADPLVGDSGHDTLYGLAGNDALGGAGGDDLLVGGDGIDFAIFLGVTNQFNIEVVEGGYALLDTLGVEGRDLLYGVERIEFGDGPWAIDIDGNAGTTVKILGAVFGADSIRNEAYVGIGLDLLDAGMSYEALMQLALDARLGPNASNTAVVNLLYTNVVGSAPSASDLAYFVGLLNNHTYTPASLGVLAAETELNALNIDLVGLAEVGIGYV